MKLQVPLLKIRIMQCNNTFFVGFAAVRQWQAAQHAGAARVGFTTGNENSAPEVGRQRNWGTTADVLVTKKTSATV